ncbi:MAG: aminotransferase class III-fold pyridoxal phosphate-dependent enzyme [Acidimicrobiales bacterium]|nr:aminotransferase class III-fold pyridoxal phosphate-dependent enzyme [Acidimicrobiales bacterium]MCB1016287.1 aminotransferase class III-fold pyridoxal phosphate-dependent enzyme [Acidimicrobiales bacterium]MCB9372824.1 aminotransferase class III-fold pyridoxal phosphate-dependent enzyme [Microthrixaceae bacterium]
MPGSPLAADPVAATEDLLDRAHAVLAYGGLDGMVTRPLRHPSGALFPHFAVAADGAEVTDSTGRVHLDWLNGWGPVFLGYRHPAVEAAVRAQFGAGPTLSLMHPVEVEVAERICVLVPCAERVAFAKNGSDALNAAVRVARAATGRDLVLQHGFHGFHEWYTCVHPDVQGIPSVLRTLVEPFPYNDLEALAQAFRRHRGAVAAVVMEPTNQYLPEPGYLEGVIDLAHRNGAVVVFDEVVTAFRLANGGAQEHFGVTPDLACLGKALANGLPLSAVVGRADLMELLPSVGFGLTFRGETFSLAAASAVLDVLESRDVAGHLAAMGTRLRDGYLGAAERHGVEAVLLGPPQRMSFDFPDQHGVERPRVRELFLEGALVHGVLTDGNALASLAHTEATVDESVARLDAALAGLRDDLDREGRAEPASGAPRPRPRLRSAPGRLVRRARRTVRRRRG